MFIIIRDADGITEKRGAIVLLGAGMTLDEDTDGHPLIDSTGGGGGGGSGPIHGNGDPNGVVTATFGDVYIQDDAITHHPFWVKRSAGTGNTGWRPHAGFGSSDTLSIALGEEANTSQVECVALGYQAVVDSEDSIAIGSGATVSSAAGWGAVAIGVNAQALGDSAVALGANTVASGDSAQAFGPECTATGPGSMAYGVNNDVSGNTSLAIGRDNVVSGNYSLAIGTEITLTADNVAVFGGPGADSGLSLPNRGYTEFSFGQTDTSTTLSTITFRLAQGSTTNQNAGDWKFEGSRGTGTGTRGAFRFYAAQPAVGTALHTLTERLRIEEGGVAVTGTMTLNGVDVGLGGAGGGVSGTVGTIAKFTSTNTCGDSALVESGTAISSSLPILVGAGSSTAPSLGFTSDGAAGFWQASSQVFVAGGGTNQTVASFYSGSVFGLALTTVQSTSASLLLCGGTGSPVHLTHKDTPGLGLKFIRGAGTNASTDEMHIMIASGTRGDVTGTNQAVAKFANTGLITLGLTGQATSTTALVCFPPIAGTPTGAATDGSFVFDSTANKIWVRLNSTWKYAQLT